MTFLAKLLGTTGSGGWIIYAIIAAGIFGAGATSATWVVHKLDGVTIAQLHTDVAQANGRTDKAEKALAEQQTATAIDVARANTQALASEQALAAKAADLQARLAVAEKARREASTKLLDNLKAIPHDQQAPLPPSVREYLRGVRDAQATGAAAPADPPH